MLTFYPLGKTNSGKPWGEGGGGWRTWHCPLLRRRVNFPGEEFSRTWIDIFKCALRWKEKKKLKQERDVSYTLHRSLYVTAIYHQNHQYETSTRLSNLVFPREFWSDLEAVGIVLPNSEPGDASYLRIFFELFVRHENQLVVVMNKIKILLFKRQRLRFEKKEVK